MIVASSDARSTWMWAGADHTLGRVSMPEDRPRLLASEVPWRRFRGWRRP